MSQELELELTFLAKKLPNEIKTVKPVRIMDIYIPDTKEHSHLRLRQKGNHYEITKKNPAREGDSSEQIEQTIPLTESEFNALKSCSHKVVVKDRYQTLINGQKTEIDVFTEKLKGLVLVDFEFNTAIEKANFVAPEFLLANVTQEEFIAGGVLAGKSYEDLVSNLNRFDYQKI